MWSPQPLLGFFFDFGNSGVEQEILDDDRLRSLTATY
jgi:hypothetical protein